MAFRVTKPMLWAAGGLLAAGAAAMALGRGTPRPLVTDASFGLSQKDQDRYTKKVTRGAERLPGFVSAAITAALGISRHLQIAIYAIEASGSSPDAFRFEPHVFNRKSSTKVPCTLTGGRPYSRVKEETNWDAMLRGFRINPPLALASSSWGAFQVLNPIGKVTDSPSEWIQMWTNAGTTEKWNLSARLIIGWFKRMPVRLEAARAFEASGGTLKTAGKLAYYYNGKSYAVHGYDKKLAFGYHLAKKLR